MKDDLQELEVAAAARALGLELAEPSLAAVTANLALLRAMAGDFMDLPLDPHLDPAVLLKL
jgi:hypothetical protein